MSRSNPTENAVHPCTRWLEWHGSKGHLEYYDKTEKKKIVVGDDFTFIVLDQLSTVKGWHDASESGIFANEVKDTRTEPLTVKAFKQKGLPLAEGIYRDIKDRVDAAGGYYVAMIYLAFRDENGELHIGSLAMNGAALRAWMDFQKEHRSEIDSKAVKINGSHTGKKGSITFKVPKFEIEEIDADTNAEAITLDKQLQKYLAAYLTKAKAPAHHEDEPPPDYEAADAAAAAQNQTTYEPE